MGADVGAIHDAALALDPSQSATVQAVADLLDEASAALATSLTVRQNIGNATNPSIWPPLALLWSQTLSLHMLPVSDTKHADLTTRFVLSIARFTRNLVPGVPENQRAAFAHSELAIRKLLHQYTSYSATQTPDTYPLTRMLTQALSNLITTNDPLADQLWSTYLSLPEEQSVLIRLFSSPDPRTLSSAFVLVLNCVHDSPSRIELLETATGPRIFLSYLDRMATLVDAEEGSEEARAFDIGYEIVSRVIEAMMFPRLYSKMVVEAEPITPHQTTFLKLLDSYLHSAKQPIDFVSSRRQDRQDLASEVLGTSLLDMLVERFLAFAAYAQSAIRQALGAQGAPSGDGPAMASAPREAHGVMPLQELDLLLPKVCEALVLATQCLTTISLRAEEAASAPPMSSQTSVSPPPKVVIAAATSSAGEGFVECLIECLRLVDVFVPRITYGKLVERPVAPVARDRPADSPPASDSEASPEQTTPPERGQGPQQAQTAAAQAFAHVKRDLVRLLGILASNDRAVQDRVRTCGGIPVVMNLCVVDDYNPYLREHALFALRNLLHGNLENQAVVDAVRPVGRWDDDRVLQELRS